jgi:quercetin dioxygenase-like cupin family protein
MHRGRTVLAGVLLLGTGTAAFLAIPAAKAPEPAGTKRVVLENDRVRAQAIDYPPGARGPEHEHAHPRAVVVLEGGSLEIRDAGGEAKSLAVRSGDVLWRPAEKHAIANTGTTPVRLVEIDVLDCPPR